MGAKSTRLTEDHGEVGFDSFEVLRAIGKGAFGKVCLVERRTDKKIFAMKYVNKQACLKRNSVKNVFAEVDLLKSVDHNFVVSLYYTFQDAEDLFIILEPLMGGDLRFHMKGGDFTFSEEQVRFICAETSLALDFLRSKSIVHRDVKPDNVLLDQAGHAHLTDFNVAIRMPHEFGLQGWDSVFTQDKMELDGWGCQCQGGAIRLGLQSISNSKLWGMAGTRPYMAPELLESAVFPGSGYSFSVDWWSVGIMAYELRTGLRPFDIHHNDPVTKCLAIIQRRCSKPSTTSRRGAFTPSEVEVGRWSPEFTRFIQGLLTVSPIERISSAELLQRTRLMSDLNFNRLANKRLIPPFVPANGSLNCDPTFELEEMIVEAKPLHKKKKRLRRQQTLLTQQASIGADDLPEANDSNFHDPFLDFPNYNREAERLQEVKREKERQWEEELKTLMDRSGKTTSQPIPNDAGSMNSSMETCSCGSLSAAGSAT